MYIDGHNRDTDLGSWVCTSVKSEMYNHQV